MGRPFISRDDIELIGNHFLGDLLAGRSRQQPYTESLTQNYKIGSRLQGLDGLVWHYCQCGANGIVAAYRDRGMASLVVPSGAFTTIGAQGIGSRTLVINDTGSAANRPAGYYANGKIEIWNAVAAEHMHRIIADSTVGNGTSITLTLYYPLAYAVPALTGGEICRSIYAEVDQTSAIADPERKSVACVPMMGPITASYFFWGQTWGMCTIAAGAHGSLGEVDNDRDVYFQPTDSTIQTTQRFAGIAGGTSSPQRAGFLLPNSAGGSQTIIMLQLDP